MRSSLVIILLCICAASNCAPVADRITSLPGLKDKINFEQYAGYVSVDQAGNRNLFYWFVQSEGNPATDPLVLWLQGGPGCSSLLGFFTELGPFKIQENNTVTLNPASWNKQVNNLFLESPAGVGFSYDARGDYVTGDNRTFEDTYNFLQKWFALYPEFSKNEFHISGESYGGHYVPQLAYAILEGNKAGKSNINLKGILVGNPWTDSVIDTNSIPPFIFYHHLCSFETWNLLQEACNLTSIGEQHSLLINKQPFHDHKPRRLRGRADPCDHATQLMYDEVGDNTNQYDIYTPCVTGAGLDCIDYSPQINYLNSAEVQKAIHAKKPAVPWTICVDELPYRQSWTTVLNIYPTLMDNIRVTVYAGDVTWNVPALGTEIWVKGLGRPITHKWQHWDIGGQVAGYFIKYKGITYVNVKNSGHMVPFYT